jgi:hypothetical protein
MTAAGDDPRLSAVEISPTRRGRRSGTAITEALSSVLGLPAVRLPALGATTYVTFDLNVAEHQRRCRLGVDAVTSTALLHGLWLLPRGVAVDAEQLPDQKLDRLRRHPALVREHDGALLRLYEPIGTVPTIACTSENARRAVQSAARHSPIHERLAVVRSSPSLEQELLAVELGVGIVVALDGVTRLAVPAKSPECGEPAVYRWWVAEVAYSRWCYKSAQLVS